jgi:tripartite-type tricarboxylate transporter receptor subunit TctC
MKVVQPFLALVAAVLTAQVHAAGSAHAGPYPDGKVTIVDPYAAGGGIDLLARIVGEQLAKKWNQTVLIENRVGASGIIGSEHAARSAPDGRTLLVTPLDVVINPSVYTRKPDDPLKRIVPVASLAVTNYVIAANPSKGYSSIEDLVAKAKANPGSLTYGTCGAGAPGRLVIQLLERVANAQFRYVPYRGGCMPAVNDALGGHIDFVISGSGTVVQPIRSGLLQALAISSGARDKALPDVPTLKETKYPIAIDGWIGLFAPDNTPTDIVDKIYGDLKTVYDSNSIKRIEDLYLRPSLTSPEEFRAEYQNDVTRLSPLMEGLNVEN